MYTPDWHVSKWSKEKKAKSDELCRRGSFRHLLLGPQREFYSLMFDEKHKEISMLCSRKFGKSYAALLIAYEFAYRHANSTVRFILPTLKTAKEVIYPIYNELKEWLPVEVVPELYKSEAALKFNNGSRIVLGGATAENIESSRGPLAHLIICDEAASFDAGTYDYAIYSVLKPQLTTTGGKTLFLTTPPKSPNHPFIMRNYADMVGKGSVVFATIDNNPLLDDERKKEIEEEYGGRDNPNFRREYLAELVPDQSIRLIPEFTVARHTYKEKPEYKDSFGNPCTYFGYVGGDAGLVDNTGLVFGYLDHNLGKLIIEHEWVDNYKTLTEIAKAWNDGLSKIQPILYNDASYIGTMDIFDIAAFDLRNSHGLRFVRPSKKKLEDTLSFLRNCFEQDKILINPDCKKLIWELQYAVWDEKKHDVARNEQQSHADLTMALAYIAKKVNWKMRPGQQSMFTLG